MPAGGADFTAGKPEIWDGARVKLTTPDGCWPPPALGVTQGEGLASLSTRRPPCEEAQGNEEDADLREGEVKGHGELLRR